MVAPPPFLDMSLPEAVEAARRANRWLLVVADTSKPSCDEGLAQIGWSEPGIAGDHFRKASAHLHALLLAAGRTDEAEVVAAEAVRFDPSEEMHVALAARQA